MFRGHDNVELESMLKISNQRRDKVEGIAPVYVQFRVEMSKEKRECLNSGR